MATAATLTPRRFGASVSGAPSAFTSAAPSMADTLPAIDFNFSDLRQRMAQFTARFDEFIERGRKRVLEERNAFRMNMADIEDQQKQQRQAISETESKASSHANILAKDAQETEEMHEAIRALSLQRDEHLSRRDELKSEVTYVQSSIRQHREAQTAYQKSLDAQAKQNAPELRFWERCLGLRVEATGVEDQLRFVFVCLDARDSQREAWFDLQMSGREYEVVGTKPRLDREDVSAVQDRLNETKELGGFLREIRALFVRVMML